MACVVDEPTFLRQPFSAIGDFGVPLLGHFDLKAGNELLVRII